MLQIGKSSNKGKQSGNKDDYGGRETCLQNGAWKEENRLNIMENRGRDTVYSRGVRHGEGKEECGRW